MSERPLASVSLDVDNLWSYMKTHGDAGWEARPSYLDVFCPAVLERLERLGLRITFFLVGVDAARPLMIRVAAPKSTASEHRHDGHRQPERHQYGNAQAQ